MKPRIVLTPEQEREAERLGKLIERTDAQHGAHPLFKWTTPEENILAVRAFMGACDYFKQPFPGVTLNSFEHYKVNGFRVRASKYYTAHLLIQENDSPEDQFLLVTSKAPSQPLYFHGSIKAADGMRPEWRVEATHPYWKVPQSALTPLPTRQRPAGTAREVGTGGVRIIQR